MNAKKVLKKGFTLIEVVIVLAIAALIMVVVFLAVTGAQRAQRDQARKDYANAGLAKIQEFAGNNGGSSDAMTPGDFVTYMNARTINGVDPGEPAASAEPNGEECDGGPNTNTVGITVGATPAVSVCLESDVQYTAQ